MISHKYGAGVSTTSEAAASRALFIVVGTCVVLAAVSVDRTFMIDQQAYLDYFAEGPSWSWLQQFANDGTGWVAAIARLFTEEFLWRIWTGVAGVLLNPAPAVVLTVALVNTLLVTACSRLPNPSLATLLWVLMPTGLAVTGVIQIRQGLALAVLLFVALRMHKPVLGSLLAALIHTTFFPVLIFCVIGALLPKRRMLAAAFAVVCGVLGAHAGSLIFDAFGGRRLALISADEGATSINYVIVALVSVLPSAERVANGRPVGEQDVTDIVLDRLAIAHIGVVAFTSASFFIFPIGTSRIGYLISLLLVPVLGAVHSTRKSAALASAAAWLSISYLVGKAFVDGGYRGLLDP